MGGYVFLTEKGKELWRLNLGGAIVWYGLLEELGGRKLPKALLEEHNWGELWDSAAYRELVQDCVSTLASGKPLPPATEAYRVSRKESVSRFRADALRIFRDSLHELPRTGRFIAADDLSVDWLEEPCSCGICRVSPRPNPRMLAFRERSAQGS